MTIWYDFTTTLRSPGRNGIANVEWSAGIALLDSGADVRCFALHGRSALLEIDPGSLGGAVYATDDSPPAQSDGARTWRDGVRALLRHQLGPRSAPIIRAMSRAYQASRRALRAARHPTRARAAAPRGARLSEVVRAGDVVISLGADWEADVARGLGQLRAATGCKVVTMVHDLIPLTHPHLAFANVPDHFIAYYEALLAASDLIVCNSEQSRLDLLGFAAERGRPAPATEVIQLGDSASGEPVERAAQPGDFFLWVGTVEARKNLEVLYDALRLLEAEHAPLPTLVVAGAIGWGVSDLLREIALQSTPASRALVLLGPVDVPTLNGLYARARALLFPSFFEGYGLPVREAAIRGCPVAAGEGSAVREALQDFAGAVFLSPDDPTAWADFMRRDVAPVDALAARPWSVTAAQLLRLARSADGPL